MQIITTTGCYGTGSSAVTDFLKEFGNISCRDDYEVRFVYDPDGIDELEYYLFDNPNRHNSSNQIKRFLKNMETLDHVWFIKRYSKHISPLFMNEVKK